MESLFSLEVVVNYVKLDNLKPDHYAIKRANSCLFPSVAFRLLDYPTIAINLLDNYDAKELKTKLEITEPFDLIEKLPCFTELLDKYGRYIFSKGKSCLFRCDIETLRGHLSNAPMYLMLLDTYFEPYKLIGTSLVPLTNLINDIYEETYANNEPSTKRVDTPCCKMTHGVVEIKNLMGEEIGHISFACRLTSFGNSLLPHIETTTTEAGQRRLRNAEVKQSSKPLDKPKVIETRKEEQEEKEIRLEPDQETYLYNLKKKTSQASSNTIETMGKNDALVQTVVIDYKDAQIQISDYPNSSKKDKSTQSPNTKRKFPPPPEEKKQQQQPPADVYHVKHVQDEFVFNHFCPPALHYNSKNDDSKNTLKSSSVQNVNLEQNNTAVTMILNQNVFINKRIEYLNEAADHEETICEDDESEQRNKKAVNDGDDDEDTQYYFEKPNTRQQANVMGGQFSFDQMPLLKCLFDEMTKLKSLMESAQPNSNLKKITSKEQLHGESKASQNMFSIKKPGKGHAQVPPNVQANTPHGSNQKIVGMYFFYY